MNAIGWLLESDPAIRWQVMRDLTGEAAEAIAAERAKVATHGWGAHLLAALPTRDGADGPEWDWLRGLLLLRDMGLDPASVEALQAIAHVRGLTWQGILPQDASWHGRPFFAGEVEPCINGRVVSVGAYFGQDVRPPDWPEGDWPESEWRVFRAETADNEFLTLSAAGWNPATGRYFILSMRLPSARNQLGIEDLEKILDDGMAATGATEHADAVDR